MDDPNDNLWKRSALEQFIWSIIGVICIGLFTACLFLGLTND